MKIFVLVKKNIFTIVVGSFLVFLVLFSKNNLSAAKDGLTLWATCVVPSLFPFFIATELLNYTNITNIFGKALKNIMRPLFNIPGEGAYAFIMGIISGCPIGAKIVSDLYSTRICTKDEAERMLCFTNNSGPLFIIGTVGILLFGNSTTGMLLFITHLLSAISVGLILGISSRFYKSSEHNSSTHNKDVIKKDNVSISNLGEVLATSISKSITNIFQIGGFVVLFSVILSILNRLNIISSFSNFLTFFNIPYDFSKGLISGIIELTNGVNIVSKIHTKAISNNIALCAFLLGFGGISIALQVLSIVSKFGLSVKTYFHGKVLQGLFQAFYTLLLVKYCSIFNMDIPSNTGIYSSSDFIMWIIFVLLIMCICLIFTKQKRNAIHNF